MQFSHKPFDSLTLLELHDLLWLRNEVFVVHQQITAEAEVDGEDPKAVHILGRDEQGKIKATARLFFTDHGVKVGRVAVAVELHRSGVGTALMRYVHTVIGARPGGLSAQAHLQGWYERLGWQAEGEIYDEADIPHIRMKRPGPDTDTETETDTDTASGLLRGLLISAMCAISLSFWACSAEPTITSTAVNTPDATTDQAPGPPKVETWAPFRVATFNTGTTAGIVPSNEKNGGYTKLFAQRSDDYYGNGLAWRPAVTATQAWFKAQADAGSPIDLVGFQEMFWSGACTKIPAEAQTGFVCETWKPGDPTVASVVLGPGYQVVCHAGKPDKCIAVRKAFGRVRGCDTDFCLVGGTGLTVEGCGKGSRIVRFRIDRVDGALLTVVHVHGSSGLKKSDQGCRVGQFKGIFTAMDDGAPGIDGDVNVVFGDFNTDPHRFKAADESARSLLKSVAYTAADAQKNGKPLHFITPIGDDAPATYGGIASIDHVLSDKLQGTCWAAGTTTGKPDVLTPRYFDHKPIVCTLRAL